jgi:hypothetical protein
MTLALMLGLFAAFMLIGAPIGFAMGLSAVAALAVQGQAPLLQFPLRMFGAPDSYALMAVPLFILAGSLMDVGGITGRIVGLANLVLGRLRGGLASVGIDPLQSGPPSSWCWWSTPSCRRSESSPCAPARSEGSAIGRPSGSSSPT